MRAASSTVYRVLQQPMPRRLEDIRADEYRYGANILYMDGPAPSEPVRVPGTVIHSTLVETTHYLGTHNPMLEHLEAFQRIEHDKFFEAELIRSVAPHAIARTELVGRLWRKPASLADETHLAAIEREMSARYPNGFVLKPLAGFSADGRFPSERTPFVELWRAYKAEVEPERLRLLATGMDPTDVHHRLKAAPAYPGHVLDAVLAAPDSVMIQERLELALCEGVIEEYRVHVVDGRVLAHATQHRWGQYRTLRPERIAEVEAFVQDIVGRLPAPYDRLTYGVDIVGLTDGSLAYMEGNAGWESQYFYAEFDIWVANLFAAHYAGRATTLLSRFRRFASAPGLAAKLAELRTLLRHPALRDAVVAREPITEVLAQARLVLLAELRRAPSRAALETLLAAILEFGLEPYFSHGELREIDELAVAQVA